MAGKLKMPNKKTTIIVGIIIAILAILAVTGTVVFLKDRGSTEAADLESEQVSSKTNGTSTQNEQQGAQNELTQNGEQTSETQEQNQGVTQGDNNQTTGTTDVDATGTDTTGTTASASTSGNAGTTTTTDRIQETTITRTEEVQIPERQISEGHYVGWTSSNVKADLAYADKIDAKADDLQIVKIAETKTGENLVTVGEKITYRITVSSSKELSGIEVTDKIPEMTEYVLNSVDNEGKAIDSNGNVVEDSESVKGVKWNIDVTEWNEETQRFQKELSFEVVVKSGATGKIVNADAVANGKTTEEPTETAIITTDKVATIEGKEKGQPAKVGDKVTYTIIVTNTGDIEGIANVKDESLETLINDNILEISPDSQDNANKLKEGTQINVPANGEAEISFTAIVKNINGAIKNVATIGEEKPEETIDTTDYTIKKEVTSTAKNENGKYALNELVTYKVTVTNIGSTVLKSVTVNDENSEEKVRTATNIAVDGKAELAFTHIVTEADIKEGKVVNVATSDGKETEKVTVKTEDPITKYGLLKTVTSTDENNDGKYALGETITYNVKVTNNGNQTVENIVVTDNNSEEKTATINGKIKPGESKDVTFTHIVTEADIKAGKVVNIATIGNDSSTVTTNTEDPITKYELLKTVTSTDENNDGKYALGETITYNVKVTNNGNQTVENIVVTDNNSEEKTATINGKIKPGESKDVAFTHIVTEADIKAGEVVNIATIGNDSSTVTTDTEDPNPNFVVTKTATELNGTKVNGKVAVKVGDKITYVITVENTGNVTLENVVVTDELLPEFNHTIETLNRGSNNKVSITVEYTVQEKDLKDGKLVNVAKATIPEKEETGKEELPVSNIAIEKHVAEYKNGEYTILSKEALESARYKVGDSVWYAITLTNNGEVADTVTVTDTLTDGLAYANEASETINYDTKTKTITWNTTLQAKGTKTLYIKATITNSAIQGDPISSITTGTTWWETNNGDIATGKQEASAKLFIKLDGKILENDQNNHDTDTKDYTGCVAKVNLTAKNLSGNDVDTTDANAIKVGTTLTPTTVEGYSTLNYQIFQYIVDGTDLNTIANNIKNDSKARSKGITFDPETQMIVCYVLKTESDGYHIDAVIRPKAETKIDLYNVDNIATANGKDSEEATIVVTNSTEVTKVTVKKEWENTTNIPESVDVQLYEGTNATTETATLNAENNWTYAWEKLNKYDANNNEIDYSVKEISIDLENETVTAFENNDTNGDYKVTYETTGNTTTITNTFVKPEINVTKKQYDENDAEMANGTKVEYGDTITYKIEATNSGNAEGAVTLKDTIPANSKLVENSIKLKQGETTTPLTEKMLNDGVKVTLGEAETETATATVEFKVTANAYAGEKIENIAEYVKEDETELEKTKPTQSDIEAKTQVIPTSSTTTVISNPQKVILVLDYSGSMNWDDGNGNTRVSALKTAVRSFLETFLENGKNQVMIIRYATNATLGCDFTTSKTVANAAVNRNPNGGTNTHAGLEMANKYVDANTSVILMTDGLATYYNDGTDWWGNPNVEGAGSGYDATADQKAREIARTIKGKGAKLYAIGFGLDDSRGEAMLQNIATPDTYDEDGKIKNQYYFKAMNGEILKKAFEDISEALTTDGVHMPFTTENGELVITKTTKVTVDGKEETVQSYEAGQNVEIYTENYEQGKTEPFKTYTWGEFTTLTAKETTEQIVTISEDGTLTFDLTQYMKDNNIDASKKITIRFVDPKTEGTQIQTAGLMTLVMDIVEEAETDEDIAVYEQKIEEAEQAKTAPVESKENEEEINTDVDTTNNDLTDKDTINNSTVVDNNTDNKTDNTETSTDNKGEIKDDTTSTDKTEVDVNGDKELAIEEPVINNQNDKTDNTTSITTEE